MADREEVLSGGNVAGRVVRIGATVRKPATAATPAVHALLRHLREVGFTGAPDSYGLDKEGRHVVEYVPGTLAHAMPPMTETELRRVGGVIRELHDAAASFVPPEGAGWNVLLPADREELICHHDLAPWNLVRDGDRWTFIDWDGAGPGTRVWDLAYAAHGFLRIHAEGNPEADARGLTTLADGYRLEREGREALPRAMVEHTRAMHDLLVEGARTGREPWARLYREGHAGHWGPAADYLERHLNFWERALG